MGPTVGFDAAEQKIIWPLPGIKPKSSCLQPIALPTELYPHVECPLLLSDFSENWKNSTGFIIAP
jgi:hypothetical protein